jgi:tetratricopeptide (TPR) repeat protein/CHAT domain-containing protein
MSLTERSSAFPSLKSFTEVNPDFSYVERIVKEINYLLNQQDRNSFLGGDNLKEIKKLGHLLFDQLLSKKIKQRLKQEEPSELTLNVDECLTSFPWELLYTGEDFLCLKFKLGRSITIDRDLELQKRRQLNFPLRMLIIANPTADLEASYKEGVKIKDFLLRYKDIKIDFKSFQVDSLYFKKNLREYDLFHFAGHCEFDSNEPLESGLIFKDGRVSCKDFILLSQTQGLPLMVFINACQSAKFSQVKLNINNWRYIYSLAHTFLFSGSQHYIGSLFNINDELGFEFAKNFYEEVLKGRSLGYAVREARQRLINDYGLETVAWANYILYGDPSYVLFNPSFYKKRYMRVNLTPKRKRLFVITTSFLIIGIFLIWLITYFNPKLSFLYSQAQTYFNEGRNGEVFKLAQKIIHRQPEYLLVYQLLGNTYFRLGKLEEALKNYFEYLRLAQKKKDLRNVSSAYLKIGWTYHMRGDYLKAEGFYQKAIELTRKTKDRLNEADGLSKIAVYYADKDDFQKALSFLIQSSQINQERKNNPQHLFNLACDYFNMAWIFSEIKDFDKAKEFYDKSKDIFVNLKAFPELSDYYFNMGEIALFEKRYQDALELYQKGLDLDKKLSHNFNLCSDYQMLAELYWEMGDYSEAERYFLESMELCQKVESFPVLAEVYYELGMFYKEKQDLNKAKEYLNKSLQLYQKMGLSENKKIKEILLSLK